MFLIVTGSGTCYIVPAMKTLHQTHVWALNVQRIHNAARDLQRAHRDLFVDSPDRETLGENTFVRRSWSLTTELIASDCCDALAAAGIHWTVSHMGVMTIRPPEIQFRGRDIRGAVGEGSMPDEPMEVTTRIARELLDGRHEGLLSNQAAQQKPVTGD